MTEGIDGNVEVDADHSCGPHADREMNDGIDTGLNEDD